MTHAPSAGPRPRALVLAMGNDILGDDGVGLHAARLLASMVPEGVDVIETSEAGFALLEFLVGYERVLILDAVKTGRCRPGTVLRLHPDDFGCVESPSPHYAGLPDLRRLAGRCSLPFPDTVDILAMEADDPYSIRETMSPAVAGALNDYVRAALRILLEWGVVDRTDSICRRSVPYHDAIST